MPVLDEQRYLAESVRRVLAQDYDGEVEIVLALGPSKDRTAEIASQLAASDPRIVLVDNPVGRTPHALNAAIAATRHPYVVRVDAHGFLPEGYLRDVATLLDATGAANVGGMMRVEGETSFGKAVAVAMSSPLGIGGSQFHVGGEPGPARTVYLGAFRRDVLDRARRLRRALPPRPGLGAQLPHPPGRGHRLVHPAPRGDLPAAPRPPAPWPGSSTTTATGAGVVTPTRDRQRPLPRGAGGHGGNRPRLAARAARRVRPGRRCPWLLFFWLFLAPFGYGVGVLVATYFMGRGLPRRVRVLLPLVVVHDAPVLGRRLPPLASRGRSAAA